jgi:pyruvate-formate lyase
MKKYLFGSYLSVKDKLFREFSQFYSLYPIDMTKFDQQLERLYYENLGVSPYRVKSFIYRTAAELCHVHLFKYCPFYFEVITGRPRNSGTSGFPPESGVGAWMMRKNKHIADDYKMWYNNYATEDIINTIMFVDFAHHCAGYDNVLQKGLAGIITEAKIELTKTKDLEEKEFLKAVIEGNQALIALCEKFSQKAREMLEKEEDEEVKQRLNCIAETAQRVPKNPPQTFFEALNTILLIREACISLDGIAVAVLGQLDRMLERFYLSDIQKGILTRDEAKDLITWFLVITDARFDYKNTTNGTNISVTIGGCDNNGKIVFNEVTKMIIEIYEEQGLVNPKLQARISKDHPNEYFRMLGKLVSIGSNVSSILNDDVIIPSQTMLGKNIKDCRVYAAGGCQEPILQNTEVNCRAYFYLNLLQVLNMTLFPEKFDIFRREGLKAPRLQWNSFEEFYNDCFFILQQLCSKFAQRLNEFETIWPEYSPCPFYSSTIKDCVKNRKDVTAGGARYNNSSIALVGIGNFIDSLFAVKKAIFDNGVISMGELKKALTDNFQFDEDLRQYLLSRIEKYGQDTREINNFAKKIFNDVAKKSAGMKNSRGGMFEASLFTFFAYDWLKDNTGATPDGRLRGERLSRGISPAETTTGVNIGKLFHTISEIDLEEFPGSGVIYLDMPLTLKQSSPDIYAHIIKCACQAGIIALDFNIVDRDILLKARENPDSYRSIVVRVCGYSAYFTALDNVVQDEIIDRIQRII